ncbi:M23 family metallopeptidase [Aurantiacibacter sp. MUD11]|uniref:M23 family metallopeptidase n=1 Tax=Aurantiacibacter sp. MUD11 TaxID=3003265 RepID=UPI0022AB426D|nr:M23 family metallopeptidase [Aurantiacibacter sp. MUD11]WAT18218.1 M23 family metallopeptidase [Aurantiacibacter sp. MUD11]
MASAFVEKVQVAAITATLVSAGWIVAGAFVLDRQESAGIEQQLALKQSPLPEVSTEAATAERDAAPERLEVSTPPENQTASLMIPVLNVAATDLVDNFTDERGGGVRLHEAIDIMAPEGTSVVAAAPGTVERMFQSATGGNTVYVRSEDRETIYYYAHLDEYAPGLNEGQQVRRGQRLGTVGSSGAADPAAPHLHFEIMRTSGDAEWWEPSTSINPYPLLVRSQR